MWLARDLNGNLNLFQTKPVRKNGCKWEEETIYKHYIEVSNKQFPELLWTDNPREVGIFVLGHKDPVGAKGEDGTPYIDGIIV